MLRMAFEIAHFLWNTRFSRSLLEKKKNWNVFFSPFRDSSCTIIESSVKVHLKKRVNLGLIQQFPNLFDYRALCM